MMQEDRDRDVEPERHVERETTVIHTGDRRGGGGLIFAIVLLLVILVLAFLFFSGSFDRTADEVAVNVNVDTPQIEVPEVEVPDIDVDVAPSDDSGDEGGN